MIIGLTGGIASGKSLIANEMKAIGLPIIDADVIAREIVEPGARVYDELVKEFGEDVLHHDRTLDRKALGKVIFADEEKRQKLNALMHPAIFEEMMERKATLQSEGHRTIVLDIPLLIEGNRMKEVDKVLLVYVDTNVQLTRLQERDQTGEEDARHRIRSQMPLSDKKKYADAIIDNNGTKEESKRQLLAILNTWNIEPNANS